MSDAVDDLDAVVIDGVEFPSPEIQEADGDVIFFVTPAKIDHTYRPITTGENVEVRTPTQTFIGKVGVALENDYVTIRAVASDDAEGSARGGRP